MSAVAQGLPVLETKSHQIQTTLKPYQEQKSQLAIQIQIDHLVEQSVTKVSVPHLFAASQSYPGTNEFQYYDCRLPSAWGVRGQDLTCPSAGLSACAGHSKSFTKSTDIAKRPESANHAKDAGNSGISIEYVQNS